MNPATRIECRPGPVLLVVDDEPMIHTMLQRCFGRAGYAYVGALDGQEGLDKAREIRPDVILLDVTMPGLDGRDVLDALQRDPELKDVPVVVITAAADHLSRLCVLQSGALEVVEKPFDPVILQRRLGWILEKRRREQTH